MFKCTKIDGMNLAEIRKSYTLHQLDENEAGNDPIVFFLRWLAEAIEAQAGEPTAMVLSTVGIDNRPSSRVVLLKGCEEGEFRFFSNYQSRKGQELAGNPNASILFFWKELERQVRIEGTVVKLPGAASDEYFQSRPFESRVGAVVSPQSNVISDRKTLEEMYTAKRLEYTKAGYINRPEHWGGYALTPVSIEFWQGRESRLHDRIRFKLSEHGWIKERLAP